MIRDREVCLFLTLNCNQLCRYCHRFLGIDEVSFEDNKKIIDRIVAEGITNVTFTGGEPLIYPNVLELVKYANQKGLKCKLITNGSMLVKKPEMREIYEYLDSITLSIDSANDEVNKKLGRADNHAENIRIVLNTLKEFDLKVNINTVVSKVTLGETKELGEFLKDYNINAWRIFKFIPLRETAKRNEKEFAISNAEFRINKPEFASYPNISRVEYREENDMETKYVLIMPNGNVTVTENKQDVTIGNILENSLSELLENRTTKTPHKVMRKIKALVAYNTEAERSQIVNAINNLSYAEVIGVAADGIDTYNKIVDLQPEIVFSKYNLGDMNGLDIVKKSKEKLDYKMPIFNFITNNISNEDYNQVINLAGNKINAFIPENDSKKIVNILKDFNEFIE